MSNPDLHLARAVYSILNEGMQQISKPVIEPGSGGVGVNAGNGVRGSRILKPVAATLPKLVTGMGTQIFESVNSESPSILELEL